MFPDTVLRVDESLPSLRRRDRPRRVKAVLLQPVVVQLPPLETFCPRGCLLAVFDVVTGDLIPTIQELHLYANADGLIYATAVHIPGTEPPVTEHLVTKFQVRPQKPPGDRRS
jgi:hypothetical protein